MRRPPFAFSALAAPAALLCLSSCAALFAPDRDARAPALEGFGSLELPVVSDDPAAKVLEILSSRLVAEIAAAEGRADASRAALAHGIELEAALEATEPPLLASSSRLALGGVMLRLQRWSDAERAYRDELAAQPASGWALAGLEQALAGQGRVEEARRTRTEAERAWAAADASVRRIAMR